MKPRRKICDFTTSRRRIAKIKVNGPTPRIIGATNTINHGRVELDTHADTIVFGQSFILLSQTGIECDVSPYTDECEAIKNVPIVSAATVWTSLELAETFIIILHEGLWMNTTMEHILVNPNQLRHFDVVVQENPYSSSPFYIESPDCDFVLPLIMEGTNIMAHTRTPTGEELSTCRHILLSYQYKLNPRSVQFPKSIRIVEKEIEYRRSISSISSAVLYDDNDKEDDLRGYQRRLISSLKVTSAAKPKISEIALDGKLGHRQVISLKSSVLQQR